MRCAALLKPARCKDMSHSPPVRRLALVLLVLAVRLRRTASHRIVYHAAICCICCISASRGTECAYGR